MICESGKTLSEVKMIEEETVCRGAVPLSQRDERRKRRSVGNAPVKPMVWMQVRLLCGKGVHR